MKHAPPRITVAAGGPEGLAYTLAVLSILRTCGVETHLVLSREGQAALPGETGLSPLELQAYASTTHRVSDIAAPIASGSFATLGMIVVPCSTSTLAEIANGMATTLITRAADVMLKERRRLLLAVCEAPLHLGHLQNMAAVWRMGATIYPISPATPGAKTETDLTASAMRMLCQFRLPSLIEPASQP